MKRPVLRRLVSYLAILLSLAGCTTPLTDAAGRGDTQLVLALLNQGVDINEADPNSMTALGMAAHQGHLETVRALLERGAAPRITDINGWTPLDYAKRGGHRDVMLLLIQAQTAQTGALQRQAALAPQHATIPLSDVDRLPSAKTPPKRNAYALVVGIEQYREKLPKADFADRDAKLMGEYLTKLLGYPEENVVVRLNERATKTDLEKYFETWLPNNVEAGASVFIYYSGHGAPNPKTGDAYLVPYDGDPAFVNATGYPLKRLYAALEKLPAKDITVVLDSCFSGAGGRSVLAKGARPMVISVENPALASGNTVVLAASSGDQISSTFEEKGHGLLTYFFLKGLQGDGDVNKDGLIDMIELFEYLKPNVKRVALKQYNNEQTPQLLASPEVLRKGGGRLVELR